MGITSGVLVLAAGITGGEVYALFGSSSSGNTTQDTSPRKELADPVATIPVLNATTLENTFTQAQNDMQNEALTSRLQNLVKKDKLTQAEADQYKTRLESKPQRPQALNLVPGLGPRGKKGYSRAWCALPRRGVGPPINQAPAPTTQ